MDAVKEAYGYITDGINCLMCYERLPENCHRSLAAQTIKDYVDKDLIIKHIL